jgi:hypothetical protein
MGDRENLSPQRTQRNTEEKQLPKSPELRVIGKPRLTTDEH